MTAMPSAIPESKAAQQRAHEPSMEEILASIRRIIADDQVLPLTARAPVREPAFEPRPLPPVRPSGEFSLSPPPFAPRVPRPEPAYPPIARQPEPLRTASGPPRLVEAEPVPLTEVAPRVEVEELDRPLLSVESGSAVAASFQALSTAQVAIPDPEALDAMARDLLRPMLKEWLDDNLPTIVERLVRAEIERVARGPR